jgi:RHS repeat-associated protein
MDLVAGDSGSGISAEANKAPASFEQVEISLPSLPEDTKTDKNPKGRKRFDEQTSRRSGRTVTSSKFENADGSSTVKIGEGGATLEPSGRVVDADTQFASDGKGRLKKSSGVVRVDLPESLTHSSEVVSLGVPGAKIGFTIRRNGAGAAAPGIPAPGSTVTTQATSGVTSPTPSVGQASVSTLVVPSSTTPSASQLPEASSTVSSAEPSWSTSSSTSPLLAAPASTTSTSILQGAVPPASRVPIAAQNKDGRITYKGALGPGVDLRYEANGSGVKEEIVLAAVPAIGEGVYRFPINLDGFTARVNGVGTISFLDNLGIEKWVIPLASAWEEPAAGRTPSVFSKVAISLEKNMDGGQDLVVRPDEVWLRDPLRKYPVVVDPTITPGVNAYGNAAAFVDSYNSTVFLGGCGSSDFVCAGVLPSSPTTQKAYVRYDTTGIAGSVINSSFLKISIDNCTSYPNYISIKALGSAFDPASVVWNSRPTAQAGTVVSGTVSGPGIVSVPVDFAMTKYASGEWPSFGFQIESQGYCKIRVNGAGSTYLEVTYSPPASNRQPSVPVSQTPAAGATVTSPVTMTATSVDPDGDPLQFYFQGCKEPCATSGVSFNSGWQPTGSWTFPTPVAGETWSWWAFAWDGVTSYLYNGGRTFTVSTQLTAAFQESWAWGTSPDYASLSKDNQSNSGVNTGTKRFVYEAKEAQVASAGPALAIVRTYNSAETSVGAFGLGWSSLLDSRFDSDAYSNLTFRLPDGRREYHPFAPPYFGTGPGYWSTVVRDAVDSTVTLLEKDGTTWKFSSAGRLSSVVDRNGRSLLLIYDATNTKVVELRSKGAAGPFSRSLSITWNGNQVASVSDGLNPTWNYAYVGTNLSRVCDPRNNNTASGYCIKYGYDAANRIVSVVKPAGNKDLEIGYYADGSVQWRRDGMGYQWNYSYNAATRTATTSDPLGRITTEGYNNLGQVIARTEPGDLTIATQTITYAYDSNGFLAKSTSPVGSWEYKNDYRGNRLQVKDPTGATSYYSFDNRDLVTIFRDARSSGPTDNNYRWTYGYDANGNRVRETNPFSWSRTWTYETSVTALAGMLKQETDWRGNATNYTYTNMGDVASITYPGVSGDSVTYSYDSLGRKITETGRVPSPGIQYTYDALNGPLTITEPTLTNPISLFPHGKQTKLTYNLNHLKSSEEVLDVTSSAPTTGVAPDTSRTTTYAYDTNDRQTGEFGPLSKNSLTEYDSVGNIVKTTDPDGMATLTTLNARNLPISVQVLNFVDPSTAIPAASKLLRQMTYDGAGRMLSEYRDITHQRSFTYDAMDRVLTRTLLGFKDRNGVARSIVELQRTYDSVGNVTLEKTGGGALVYAYTYDVVGRLYLRVNQSQPRIDLYQLDRNGNTLDNTRNSGAIQISSVSTTYDARNRPLVTTVNGFPGANQTKTTTYTKWGTVASETNARGATITYAYDNLGRLVSTTAPTVFDSATTGAVTSAAPVVTRSYDTFGNVSHERDPRGAVTVTKYDQNDRRTRIDYPACAVGCTGASAEAWSYSPGGLVTQHTDQRGLLTGYTYDTMKRAVKIQLPILPGGTQGYNYANYDGEGNLLRTQNAIGAVTTYTYNEANLVKSMTVTDRIPAVQNSVSVYDYNDLGQRVWERDPLGYVRTREYLQTGEETKMTDPAGAINLKEYDGGGRMVKSTDPMGRIVTVDYTQASQPMRTSRLSGATVVSTSTAFYDGAGNLATETSATGNVKNYTYDLMNRLTHVTIPLASGSIASVYGYDKNSNLTRAQNGNGLLTFYGYNERNQRTATIEPPTVAHPFESDRTFTTTYDPAGLPVGQTEPGTNLTRTFDSLRNVLSETWTGAGLTTVAKTYARDLQGRLTGAGPLGFTYNDRNQLVSYSGAAVYLGAATATNNATFTYDANGRMTAKTQPWYGSNGPISYGYNARNELTTVSAPGSSTWTNTYNLAGQPATVVQGVTTRTYAYDSIGRVSSDLLTKTATAEAVHSATYGYNLDDNLTSRTSTESPGAPESYTYDKAERIATWTRGVTTTSYTYDGAGNRLTAGTNTYTYDERNRLKSGPNNSVYTWTARGTPMNQGSTATPLTFTTDAANRITATNQSATFIYDVLDRLVGGNDPAIGQPQGFQYSGFDQEPVSGQSFFQRNYVRGPDGQLLGQTNDVAIGSDRHNDATHWYSAATGNVSEAKSYDPFGVPGISSGLPQNSRIAGYQGQLTVAGMVKMGARWYNPQTATFQGRDVLAGNIESPLTLNRYSYVSNNPLNKWDPTGRYEERSECYQGGAYDWGCERAANAKGGGVATDHPLSENDDGTPNTGSTVSVTNYADGSSQFVVIAPTGVVVSNDAGTTRSTGNLSYTPDTATRAAAVEAASTGVPAQAIANALEDTRRAVEAKPTQEATIATPENLDIPDELALVTFGGSNIDDWWNPMRPQAGSVLSIAQQPGPWKKLGSISQISLLATQIDFDSFAKPGIEYSFSINIQAVAGFQGTVEYRQGCDSAACFIPPSKKYTSSALIKASLFESQKVVVDARKMLFIPGGGSTSTVLEVADYIATSSSSIGAGLTPFQFLIASQKGPASGTPNATAPLFKYWINVYGRYK